MKKQIMKTLAVLMTGAVLLELPVQAQGPYRSGAFPLSVPEKEPYAFTAQELEQRMGFLPGELEAVTLQAAPQAGVLLVDGVPVLRGDVLLRQEISSLRYFGEGEADWFSVTAHGGEKLCATFNISPASIEKAPLLYSDHFETGRGMTICRKARTGEPVTLCLWEKPQKGHVTLKEGHYFYTPYWNEKGQDRFMLGAVDERGQLCRPVVITVNIRREMRRGALADMTGRSGEFAAQCLWKRGIMKRDPDRFCPEEPVTAEEFRDFWQELFPKEAVSAWKPGAGPDTGSAFTVREAIQWMERCRPGSYDSGSFFREGEMLTRETAAELLYGALRGGTSSGS